MKSFQLTAAPSAPVPAKSDFKIGVYLFHAWRSLAQWRPIADRPLLGYYDVANSQVADWQIKWALEHGISYFAYDWYWRGGKTAHRAGLEAILKSKFIDGIKFCLHQCDESYMSLTEKGKQRQYDDWGVEWDLDWPQDIAHTFSELDTAAHQEYILKKFLTHPSYLRLADGRAVYMLYRFNIYLRIYGIAGMRRWIEDFRRRAAKYNLELFFIAAGSCVHPGYLEAVTQSGADGLTSYNYPWSGARKVMRYGREMLIGTYDELTQEHLKYWQRFSSLATQTGLKLIVPLCCGFDNSPWSGTVVRYGTAPQKFAAHCRLSLPYFDDLKLGVVNAFNEWGEGSYCEPSACWGFEMLEAIRSVFAPESQTPRLEVPEDVTDFAATEENVPAVDADL